MPSSESTRDLLQKLLEEGDNVVSSLQGRTYVDCLTGEEGLLIDANGRLLKQVSDIKDADGYQYVNLVQQGGGVLGIALLGYTYVLERVGIRFAKLAGTSAGAINSSLLASIRPESAHTLKSPVVLHYLASKNLFDLVDGHPIARTLIRNLIKTRQEGEPSYATKLTNSVLFLLKASLPLLLLSSLLLWQSPRGVFSLLVWLCVALVIAGMLYVRGRLKDYTPPPRHSKAVGEVKRPDTSFVPMVAFFFFAVLLLLLAWLMAKIPAGDPHQLAVEFGPIVLLLGWSLGLLFSNAHYRPFQVGYLLILLVILVTGYLNKVVGVTVFGNSLAQLPPYVYLSVTAISLLMFFLLFVGSVGVFLAFRFRKSRFGINRGENFRNWIAELMADGAVDETVTVNGREERIQNPANGIRTLSEFNQYYKTLWQRGLRYEPRREDDIRLHEPSDAVVEKLLRYDPNHPPIVLITAEVITQNKIEFPKMTPLFWESDADVVPADFVRASMSLPVFFEPYTRPDIPKRDNGLRPDYWKQFLDYGGNLPKDAVFQDGGILSNFPVNVFFNASLDAPRLPTFGVRLDDADQPDSAAVNSLFGLIGSVFNTARSYYDKDFLITNRHYQLCIGEVDVRRFNWIDFNMPDAEKIRLFRQGALTAASFLAGFDWYEYKKRRAEFLGKKPDNDDPAGME